MKLIDARAREFLYFCDNYHFFALNSNQRKKLCEHLCIKNEQLDEIIEYCFEKKYADFFDFGSSDMAYYVSATNHGLRSLGLAEEAAQ